VAELLIFIGLFDTMPSIALLTLVGILLSGIYSFVLITRVLYGPATGYIKSYYDISRREFYILLLSMVPVSFFGLFPSYFTAVWAFQLENWL